MREKAPPASQLRSEGGKKVQVRALLTSLGRLQETRGVSWTPSPRFSPFLALPHMLRF